MTLLTRSTEAVRSYIHGHPGVRGVVQKLLPSRRRAAAQWARIEAAVATDTVLSGPFAGMRLLDATTGSHIPKRLGCYELELQPLVEEWADYSRIIDVGCGEGWYVVGLARRLPAATVYGFDISAEARRACVAAAATNSVAVEVGCEATPERLNDLIVPGTLLIVDIEGAEVDLIDPARTPALAHADVLIELHDFMRPGATEAMLARFADRPHRLISQIPRRSADYPRLAALSAEDQHRATDESRPAGQQWLWIRKGTGG